MTILRRPCGRSCGGLYRTTDVESWRQGSLRSQRRYLYEDTFASHVHGRKLRCLVLHPIAENEMQKLELYENENKPEVGTNAIRSKLFYVDAVLPIRKVITSAADQVLLAAEKRLDEKSSQKKLKERVVINDLENDDVFAENPIAPESNFDSGNTSASTEPVEQWMNPITKKSFPSLDDYDFHHRLSIMHPQLRQSIFFHEFLERNVIPDSEEAIGLGRAVKWDILPGPRIPFNGWNTRLIEKAREIQTGGKAGAGFFGSRGMMQCNTDVNGDEIGSEYDTDEIGWRYFPTIRKQFSESSIVMLPQIDRKTFFPSHVWEKLIPHVKHVVPDVVFINAVLSPSQQEQCEEILRNALMDLKENLKMEMEDQRKKDIIHKIHDQNEESEDSLSNRLKSLPPFIDCLDRNRIVLEIFAGRAKSRAAKLQVGIAKMNYLKSRLTKGSKTRLRAAVELSDARQACATGMAQSLLDRNRHKAAVTTAIRNNKDLLLKRRGGKTEKYGYMKTCGTKVTWRTHHDTDVEDHLLHDYMNQMRRELDQIKKTRDTHREGRKAWTIGLVGYTNSGKTELMNRLLKTSTAEDQYRKHVKAQDGSGINLEEELEEEEDLGVYRRNSDTVDIIPGMQKNSILTNRDTALKDLTQEEEEKISPGLSLEQLQGYDIEEMGDDTNPREENPDRRLDKFERNQDHQDYDEEEDEIEYSSYRSDEYEEDEIEYNRRKIRELKEQEEVRLAEKMLNHNTKRTADQEDGSKISYDDRELLLDEDHGEDRSHVNGRSESDPDDSGLTHRFVDVYSEKLRSRNLLFQTLDTTFRRVTLPESGRYAVLADSVGFIQKLPHFLFEGFRETITELLECDVLLHVRDVSHPKTELQRQTVLETLELAGFDFQKKSIIEVWNKTDLLKEEEWVKKLEELEEFEEIIENSVNKCLENTSQSDLENTLQRNNMTPTFGSGQHQQEYETSSHFSEFSDCSKRLNLKGDFKAGNGISANYYPTVEPSKLTAMNRPAAKVMISALNNENIDELLHLIERELQKCNNTNTYILENNLKDCHQARKWLHHEGIFAREEDQEISPCGLNLRTKVVLEKHQIERIKKNQGNLFKISLC